MEEGLVYGEKGGAFLVLLRFRSLDHMDRRREILRSDLRIRLGGADIMSDCPTEGRMNALYSIPSYLGEKSGKSWAISSR